MCKVFIIRVLLFYLLFTNLFHNFVIVTTMFSDLFTDKHFLCSVRQIKEGE